MKKTLLTASIIAITISGSALAARNTAAKDQLTGFYAGADVGYSSASFDSSFKDLYKNEPLAFGARLGYLVKVNSDFKAGGEFSYYSMGSAKLSDSAEKAQKDSQAAIAQAAAAAAAAGLPIDQAAIAAGASTGGKYTASNMELQAVGQYMVAPDFYLEGKVGIANSTAKVEGGDSGSKINPAFDIGAGYMVMPNLALSGDFKYIMGDKKLGSEDVNATKPKPAPVMGFLAGVTYNF